MLAGCDSSAKVIAFQENGVPHHEHEWQDWWNYQFVYHPSCHAYFEPYTGTWYWFEDDAWHMGPELPTELTAEPRLARVVKLQRDSIPFLQHDTVVAWHPSPVEIKPKSFDPGHATDGAGFRMASVDTAE